MVGTRIGDAHRCWSGDVAGAGGECSQDGCTANAQPGGVSGDHADHAMQQRQQNSEGHQKPPVAAQVAEACGSYHAQFQQEEAEDSLKRIDEKGFHFRHPFLACSPTNRQAAEQASKPTVRRDI